MGIDSALSIVNNYSKTINCVERKMRIEHVETIACDAGWRNYHYLKIVTDNGIVGWAEYDEAFGPSGLTAVIEKIAPRLIGKPANSHEAVIGPIAATFRPAPHGLSAEALGAIENALLDIKGKALGVPCHEILGGKHRDTIPVYWSHCATWRINHPKFYSPVITDLDGVRRAGREARELGVPAVKTNLFLNDEAGMRQWMPGFAAPYDPSLNVDKKLVNSVRAHLDALKEGIGSETELMIDLNFNFKTEGFVKIIQELRDYDFLWIELDSYNPDALAYIRERSHAPIAACETLFGIRQYLPYLQRQAVDVAIVDAVWNGVWQSMKIAHVADAFDVNVAPHNFYSHQATMMNIHFAAAVPNLRIMEHDIDRLAWDKDLFTHVPEIKNGAIVVPDTPGWGCDPIEDKMKAHPPRVFKGYLGL